MPLEPVRDSRTFGVTARLDKGALADLAALRHQPGYKVLLDVMEMACIEQESVLISAEVSDANRILAEHRKTQAMWQVFTHLQERVDQEVRLYDATLAPTTSQFTADQRQLDELLDATRHYDHSPRD